MRFLWNRWARYGIRCVLFVGAACGLAALQGRIFAAQDSKSTGGPDTYGYIWKDQAAAGGPTASFVDISATGMQLTYLNGTGNPTIDGGTAVETLTKPFLLYGESQSQLAISANGYISTQLVENGNDYTNDCQIPAPTSGGGGHRIYPFHDDLVVEGNGYIKYYAISPVANIAGLFEPCTIIQWNNARRGNSNTDSFDVEAILFHKTGEIRYQYHDLYAGAGNQQTIGIQNREATTGLDYACNTADSVSDASAISIIDTNPVVGVVVPDGGEVWKRGKNKTISWVSTFSNTEKVTIQLYRNASLVRTIAAQASNKGKYKWNVANDLAVGTGYAIRIARKSDAGVFDASDATFKIK